MTLSKAMFSRAISHTSVFKKLFSAFLLCMTAAVGLPAQTFTVLHNFELTDGYTPQAPPIQGYDGNLYGTTLTIANGAGSVYRITPTGTLTTLHVFTGPDGFLINGPLLLARDGSFYDTTVAGGTGLAQGTVFKITLNGTFTSLYSFCPSASSCVDGFNPYAGLTQATDGNFYGTTFQGGTGAIACGTIFKITPTGTLTTLHSFAYGDGCNPIAYPIEAYGAFFGSTEGGAGGYGTVYKLTPSGTLTVLHSFDGDDGYLPAQLILGSDGNFYGTTIASNAFGNGPGTVFKITKTGVLTTLYNFCSLTGCADGQNPRGGLLQATDGNFYGTTSGGGANGVGTIFEITHDGTLTTLHTFNTTDGAAPMSGLFEATDGTLYGTASAGGDNGNGTIFTLSVGLSPFVKTNPTYGNVGGPVRILGTNLTGTSAVTFNGIPATFTVKSPSLIVTAVPAGATSGAVQVVTPSGTLTSDLSFRVRP